MVDGAQFDRRVPKCTPFWCEIAIFKINNCCANEIITKKIVVVHHVHDELWASREGLIEIIVLVEPWVPFINLIVVALAERLVANLQNKVRV